MLTRSLALVASFATLAVVATAACSSSSSSSSPSATDYAGSCRLLASRCHPIKTTLGEECHELGHDGDDAKCGPRKDQCLAECPEGAGEEGGHDEDASTDASADSPAADAAGDAGASSACTAYCTCMEATCKTETGYPYADQAACLTACKGFDQKGLTCVGGACEGAKTAADKGHECEHASSPSACH